MKKNYFLATLLIVAFGINLNAQIELDGKEPVFWLKFDALSGTHLRVEGTEAFGNFVSNDGTQIDNDTIEGHAWGGGDMGVFTLSEQVISSDSIPEQFLPAMFWDSYVSIPDRPQGIAAYSNGNGGYSGPRGTSARSVSFFVLYTDTARVDTAGTNAWGGNHMFFDGGKWDLEGGGGMVRWLLNPADMKMEFDWGLSKDFTAENTFERNEWVHLALTIPDGAARSDIKLYVNGIHEEFLAEESWNADGVDMTNLNTTPTAGWDGIRIGRLANVWMSDYRVYDSELSQNEVRELMGRYPLFTPDVESQNMFRMYPVPNNGQFTLETAKHGVNKVVIRNLLGQVVHNQIVDRRAEINVNDLPKGIYLISLSDELKNIQTRKFLIE